MIGLPVLPQSTFCALKENDRQKEILFQVFDFRQLQTKITLCIEAIIFWIASMKSLASVPWLKPVQSPMARISCFSSPPMSRTNSWEQYLIGLQNPFSLSWMHSNHLLDSNFCNRRPGTAQMHGFCYNTATDRMIKIWQSWSDYMRRNMSNCQKRAWGPWWGYIGKAVGRRRPGMSFRHHHTAVEDYPI